jgi:phosphatidylglycerophosphatase A
VFASDVITPLLAKVSVGGIVVLIVAVILILFGLWRMPDIMKAAAEGDRKALGEVLSETGAALVLCVAQGFGIGRVRFAPGTFGSLLGLLWCVLLIASGEYWAYLAGTFFGLALSVVVCGWAEKILDETDPPSVVFDEIAAMPVCFLPWVTVACGKLQGMPPIGQFLTTRAWLWTVAIFALFRAVDVLKPWPIRQSQNLPGGWGVTVDDLLAGIVVGAASLFFVA